MILWVIFLPTCCKEEPSLWPWLLWWEQMVRHWTSWVLEKNDAIFTTMKKLYNSKFTFIQLEGKTLCCIIIMLLICSSCGIRVLIATDCWIAGNILDEQCRPPYSLKTHTHVQLVCLVLKPQMFHAKCSVCIFYFCCFLTYIADGNYAAKLSTVEWKGGIKQCI